MRKIPNKLSKFMYQLSGYKYHFNGIKRYFRGDYAFNDFLKYICNSKITATTPIIKLSHINKQYNLTLDSKLNNGYNSTIKGRGCDIVNALLYGYYTPDDIASLSHMGTNHNQLIELTKKFSNNKHIQHKLFDKYSNNKSISKRTVERIMKPREIDKYYLQRPHINHVIYFNNIEDDFFYHYKYNKDNKQYQLTKNNVFGRWKCKKVVDAPTLMQFEWLTHSPFIKKLRKKYRYTTHLQMLHQIFQDKQQLYKRKLKHQIFMNLVHNGNGRIFSTLNTLNNLYSDQITISEEVFHNQRDFPILSKQLFQIEPTYAKQLLHIRYRDSLSKWKEAMKYTVSNALMYVYLFIQLANKYKDYGKLFGEYHSDKYHLINHTKWHILRRVKFKKYIQLI